MATRSWGSKTILSEDGVRLIELEIEQKDIEERLEIEKRMIPTVTREQIITWLESYRTRNTDDPSFRKELFSTFLEAAYRYDDRLRLIFNYTGQTNSVDFPFREIMEDIPENPPEGSEHSPLGHQTRLIRTFVSRRST